MATAELRREFLIEELFVPDQVRTVYSYSDRIIVGGALPGRTLELTGNKALGTGHFLERREMGIINVGGSGTVGVDGAEYELARLDGLYIGRGKKDVTFRSTDPVQPAQFYFLSTPAHRDYPVEKITNSQADRETLGSAETANRRTIYKYIHPGGTKSCQLVMGFTRLEPNNVWNTMPTHTHERRTEVYLYFDIPEDNVVFHFMGEPGETRHLVIRNKQAVISPSWSIHSGAGTTDYSFIWGTSGENQTFSDMDFIPMQDLE